MGWKRSGTNPVYRDGRSRGHRQFQVGLQRRQFNRVDPLVGSKGELVGVTRPVELPLHAHHVRPPRRKRSRGFGDIERMLHAIYGD